MLERDQLIMSNVAYLYNNSYCFQSYYTLIIIVDVFNVKKCRRKTIRKVTEKDVEKVAAHVKLINDNLLVEFIIKFVFLPIKHVVMTVFSNKITNAMTHFPYIYIVFCCIASW